MAKREFDGNPPLFKKKIPKMPEGYYFGDKPNPNLRAFVEQHLKERCYDPETDDYDVPPFDKPIETTKATAIYNMHTYWSKKPHDAIRQYIRHYTKPGDLVLDPFCGSGGTALAALMEGRKAIAIDRSPAATFITKNYCTPVDVDELHKDFEELKRKVKKEIDWLYETRCDRCGGKATTAYTVYSQVFQCPRCMEKVPLFDCVEVTVERVKGKGERTFQEEVREIIREYLGDHPGSTKDRIYDEVVSRMVRSGQMEAHDFDELLGQVAEEAKVESGKNGGGRWYLKETELVIADAAENSREDSAAEKLGAFIKAFLKKHPGDEGVHYSDLFEHYIYAVKDKPRRQLAECLPDYFYKTEQGTWRLPASEEEEKAKREARVKGLGRRVKRYIAQLEQGAIIPDHERPNDATLAEWIRHCKRAGLYEQGKLLSDKGGLNPDNLPEEAMVNVEEDYQVCARMLARDKGKGQRRKEKRKR